MLDGTIFLAGTSGGFSNTNKSRRNGSPGTSALYAGSATIDPELQPRVHLLLRMQCPNNHTEPCRKDSRGQQQLTVSLQQQRKH
jgi:hypothetical protein